MAQQQKIFSGLIDVVLTKLGSSIVPSSITDVGFTGDKIRIEYLLSSVVNSDGFTVKTLEVQYVPWQTIVTRVAAFGAIRFVGCSIGYDVVTRTLVISEAAQ